MIALGRKNYLFAGSDTGGDRAAAIYTIVQTAKLNGRNPEGYLRDALARIAEGHPISRIDELLPWHSRQPGDNQTC
jgi:transposase